MEPQPSIAWSDKEDALNAGAGCGRVQANGATLTEVSLQLSEDELIGGPPLTGQEFYYMIEDAQGQNIRTDFWVLARSPIPDREKNIRWIVHLRRYEPAQVIV
jgi:hypothetical protein